LLYNNGDGILGDEEVFKCPSNKTGYDPAGDYLRDFSWYLKKPNKVIIGDNMPNHEYDAFVFLFADGHCIITNGDGNEFQDVKNVKGAYEMNDCMYQSDFSEDITPTDKYTLLSIRD
jgi:hypothetical protein